MAIYSKPYVKIAKGIVLLCFNEYFFILDECSHLTYIATSHKYGQQIQLRENKIGNI